MHTLLFVAFQISGLANGGVESASRILEGTSGWRRVVVTQLETRFCQRWRETGCEVHVWPVPAHEGATDRAWLRGRAERAAGLTRFNARIASLVRRHGIGVVHCNDIAAFWHAAPGAKAAGARVVFNVRSIFPDDVPYGAKWSLVHHLADEVVCLSEEMRDVTLARFPPTFGAAVRHAACSVIYTGLDLTKLRPADGAERAALRERLGIPADAFAVGQVAKVWEIKNQLRLLELALPELLSRAPDAHMYFVGDMAGGEAYTAACEAATANSPYRDRIHWVGFVPDATPWLRALDASVLVSRYEGLARAMIESMACGVPVVSFDVTSARELLDGTGAGVVVPKGDYPATAAALLALHGDSDLRAAMGRRAHEVAEAHFDADRAANAYRELYQRLDTNQ